jgi:hypothetical protein
MTFPPRYCQAAAIEHLQRVKNLPLLKLQREAGL